MIGSGPAGQRAAIQAAKLGKKTALVERRAVLGGVCINTGTIPSKTLREAVLYLSGYRLRKIYGESYTVKQNITIEDLLLRVEHVIRHEIDVTRHQLLRHGVVVFNAEASFTDPHTLRLRLVDGSGEKVVSAAKVVIATGTEATRDPHIPFDGQNILVSDDVLGLKRLPRTLAVVGAGVIGCEYASNFCDLGDPRDSGGPSTSNAPVRGQGGSRSAGLPLASEAHDVMAWGKRHRDRAGGKRIGHQRTNSPCQWQADRCGEGPLQHWQDGRNSRTKPTGGGPPTR